MINDSHISLVTKQRHINSPLDDRMAVWTMTFRAIPGFLVTKWGQYCPISWNAAGVVPNRINEIHVSQQHLSKFDIRPYTFRLFVGLEVI